MIACVEDADPIAPPASEAGVEGSVTTPTPSTTATASNPEDAGSDAEAFEGGGLPVEEDGGATDEDGGFDAGPACASLSLGETLSTSCASLSPRPGGGKLQTATYRLTGVIVLGSPDFCSTGGGYVAYNHVGALRVTAQSDTTAKIEFVDQYWRKAALTTPGVPIRRTTVRYDVNAVATGVKMAFTPQTCSLKPPPETATYSTGADVNGKKSIVLWLPYGTGTARFVFLEN